jgi:DNA-binding NtrC family response regulator
MATILIVDDDLSICEMLCDLLSEQHTCDMVVTAEEAMTLMRKGSYDVVISDIAMPEMSGIDLLGFIRANHPATPVIVITGAMVNKDAENLSRQGIFDYMMKPLQLQALERSVNRALQRRQALLNQMK